MKTLASIIVSFLTLTALCGDIVIYPGGFNKTSPPYYALYQRTLANGWGWAPDTNGNTVFKATYTNSVNVTMQTSGKSGDVVNSPTNFVQIANPPYSPKYRFAVFYKSLSDVPATTNLAPLVLTNFLP